MKICYFGIYDSEYSRNKILISGLKQNDVEVVECVSRKYGPSKYFDLIKQHWSIRNSYDVMIVGYPGFQVVILAKLITAKPIIFDAFISIYDSMVLDRMQVKPISLKALYFWYLDKISLNVSDIVLFDTYEHIKYVSKEFGVKIEKFRRIFVGADTTVFYPRENKTRDGKFQVLFYGTYIPLQGIEYIVQAAKLLENHKDIIFEIIGDGQEKKRIMNLAKFTNTQNINFVGSVSLKELPEKISGADVCLGIFGHTDKTKRVIPNKVYECVAMGKPVITAGTLAIYELFDDNEMFLVGPANPEKIAEAILAVKSDMKNAELFAGRAHNKFIKTVTIEKIGLELKNIINEYL